MSGIAPGASWLLPDGRMIPVPGFHAGWIAEHQDLVPGCDNVCDVVLKFGWVSVARYSEGYVELMIPSRSDARAARAALGLLAANLGDWESALVMTMDEEGYFKITHGDVLGGGGRFPGVRPAEGATPGTGAP